MRPDDCRVDGTLRQDQGVPPPREENVVVSTSAVVGIALVAPGLVLTPGPNVLYLVSASTPSLPNASSSRCAG